MSLGSFLTWLKVRALNGLPYPRSLQALEAEALKSRLLARLLEGKPIFDDPPPLSYGQPWYSLIETGEGFPTEVHEHIGVDEKVYHALLINTEEWEVLVKISPDDWVVTYRVLDTERMHREAALKRLSLAGYLQSGGKCVYRRSKYEFRVKREGHLQPWHMVMLERA